MLRWHAKVICGVIMFVLMPICFLVPIRMVSLFSRWGRRGQDFLDLLSCFAGGVFLASYLVFMAPAVRVLVETNLMHPYGIEFPLPDTLIGLGFFMMLAINYLVRAVNKCSTSSRSTAADRFERESVTLKTRHESGRAEIVYYGDENGETAANGLHVPPPRSRLTSESDAADPHDTVVNNGSSGYGTVVPVSAALSRQTSSYSVDVYRAAAVMRSGGSKRNSMVELAIAGANGQSLVRSIVMMLALSVDSVLEGMTIGLKQTVVEVWAIFIGIVVHESVIAFCLGLQLVRLNAGRVCPVVAAAVVYTLMNPLGVIVATAVYETFEADPRVDLANGILQALTSGCFIYVIFYEILDGQITENTPLKKIIAVFVGYAFLASFAAIPGSGPYHYDTQTIHGEGDSVRGNVTIDFIHTNGTLWNVN